MKPLRRDLSGLLAPKSIVVLGASGKAGNLGAVALSGLRKLGYPGRVYVIHASATEISGYPCLPSLRDLPDPADLALLALPAKALADAIRECAAAGIKNGVAWASGFAESGAEGRDLQAEVKAVCEAASFNLCGPNCTGIINSHLPFTTSFATPFSADGSLLPGNISIVSQSGMIAQFTQLLTAQHGFGFSLAISSGNEAVLSTADYIEALVEDQNTKVICVYLEGATDGARLIAALRAARNAGKPVVLLKSGMTAASARAIQSHTGALAGSGRVWEAVLRDEGAIRVTSLEEMVDVASLLSGEDLSRRPPGNAVALLAFGGGTAVIGADLAIANGLTTPPLSDTTLQKLAALVPPHASVRNPIDLTPETYQKRQWLDLLPQALQVIGEDPGIDTVLIQFGATAHPELLEVIDHFRATSNKLICVSWLIQHETVRAWLRERRIHAFSDISRALRAVSKVCRPAEAASPTGGRQAKRAALDWAALLGPLPADGIISEHRCNIALASAGLPVAPARLTTTWPEVQKACDLVTYPVAMKGISSAVTHRAAANLLALDIRTAAEAEAAFQKLSARALELGIALDGVYVQHMVRGQVEILVSAFRDPVFGDIVSCGAGGTLTEFMDDVVLACGPVDVEQAAVLLGRLRLVQYHQKKGTAFDLASAAGFLSRISEVAADIPWPTFTLEINPIKCSAEGVCAVDSLLLLDPES